MRGISLEESKGRKKERKKAVRRLGDRHRKRRDGGVVHQATGLGSGEFMNDGSFKISNGGAVENKSSFSYI